MVYTKVLNVRIFRTFSIFHSLSEEGVFIFGDLVTYRNPESAALNEARHYHHLVENAQDENSLKEWAYHHKYLNKLAPIEDQVEWLEEVGFRKVEVLFTKFNTALIVCFGYKPRSSTAINLYTKTN